MLTKFAYHLNYSACNSKLTKIYLNFCPQKFVKISN